MDHYFLSELVLGLIYSSLFKFIQVSSTFSLNTLRFEQIILIIEI